MGEKKYNFDHEKTVADLLGSLQRVEAPTNFDARVRSRIAQGMPSSRAGWLMPSAAAVSLGAVLLTAMVFVYFRGPDAQIADATQPEIAPVIVSESPNPQFALTREPEPPIINNVPAPPVVAEKGDAPVPRPKTAPGPKGGDTYYDRALRPEKDPIVPFGTSATPEANIRPPGRVIKVSAREVLQLIGLDAEFRDGGWLVQKVSENSMAARSGVRNGDVVEAIDDTKIAGNTTFENGFNGKNLTVIRNGNRQTISIQN
jgi:membrane-associated protease RseP (regulator of RpoE activity)